MNLRKTAIAWGQPLPAPAKINLFLHVVGRRADGYHLLQTAFRMLDQGDELVFTPRSDGQIVRVHPLAGVAEDQDLCVRAARLLQAEAGIRQGVAIRLEKRLPMGGGLGGGSSDAATVLLALNELWGLHWPRQRLQALGLRLGADVPFFIFGHSAFAEGVGEALQAITLPPAWYLVLVPDASVPTAEIFSDPALTRDTPTIRMPDFSAVAASGVAQAHQFGRNDLEPVASRRYPQVAQALDWLRSSEKSGTVVRMSGSGASVFAAFATEQDAQHLLARLPSGRQAWVAQGVDEHPLISASR